jgi:1,4-dihydroxy-2-naphthoate octaprenyltransferase
MKGVWLHETRPQFLLLSVVLVLHGAGLAFWRGTPAFDWLRFALAMLGLTLMHAAVNVLNDWHDWAKTGIDRETPKTPFSGGSGILPAGGMDARSTLWEGTICLVAGCVIGLYLVWDTYRVFGRVWPLLVIGLVGALAVVAYTPFLTRIGLGELFAGLGLGNLPVLGTYYVLTGRLDWVAVLSGIPATLLTYNLLLLNEFPDTAADAKGGRRHMVARLTKRGARWLYAAVESAAYVVIVAGVLLQQLTPWALLGLVALPFALKAIATTLREYEGVERLLPAMGANVAAVLSTNALLALGYLIARLVAN